MTDEREEDQTKTRWLDVCTVGLPEFALVSVMLQALPRVPNLQPGYAELFSDAASALNRTIMQEVGRVAFEAEVVKAMARFNAIMDDAKAMAEEREA